MSEPPPPPGRVQQGPYVVRCGPGRYAYCRCQRSARFPLCDGTHRGTEFQPIKVDLDRELTVAWCCCGKSRNLPYCDGSHAGI
ncbi:MAG: CDGSH iron-sulfur domain-containing protein [Planctomycetes bacterium]|nr:CDGSH iron-sulfur domain-containing protein [Planctomycetota bacterium]